MLKCPDCDAEYRLPTSLGVHRRFAHGIAGKFTTSPINPPATRKYTKRSELAIATPSKNGITHNGHKDQGHRAPDGIPEATLALALGRFQGFCTSMAHEFDIPPRLFTARLSELIYRTTLR
jgi:hypothetical protein